jgi:hypothetical protein
MVEIKTGQRRIIDDGGLAAASLPFAAREAIWAGL